jgi:hypothetical protein
MSLIFGEPHRRVSCGPHANKEKSVIPPRWCRVLLHALRRLGNLVPPRRGCDDGLDDEVPFLVKRLIVFCHMVAALSLTNKYPGFSTGNKVHQCYYGVWTLSGLRM